MYTNGRKERSLRRDRTIELTIALGALVPGRAVAAAAPRLTVVAVLLAGLSFAAAVICGPHARSGDNHELTLLAALLLPGVLAASGLHEVGAPLLLQNTVVGLILVAVLLALADARDLLTLPVLIGERGKRLLALPWIALLAASFNAALEFAAGELSEEPDLGFTIFILGLILPLFFAFFVVAPAKLVDLATVSRGRWAARYGLAVLCAFISATALSRLGGAP
ncbi:MAG: hypothetical protein R3A79_20600 [Nannocystaceae bacterium]